MSKQIIIAHRGESFLAPENTLAAINMAWKKGDEAVEIDIRLTKDNQIVVFHDANTRRLSGKYKNVENSDLIELRQLDVGRYKNEKYLGEKIPTLKEVLKTVPNNKKILIEIKSSHEIIPILKKVIDNSKLMINQIEIISFDIKTLIEVKNQLPQFSVFWILALSKKRIRKIFQPSFQEIIKKALACNLQGLDLWADGLIDSEIIKKIKLTGLKLYIWTVNNPKKAQDLFDMGVDGITTDRAQWMKDQLKS